MDLLEKDLRKIIKAVEKYPTKVIRYEPNKCRVLLTRLLKRRIVEKALESSGRYKVVKVVEPDIKIDETVCILYVDRLCFQDDNKRKRNAKNKSEAIIKSQKK